MNYKKAFEWYEKAAEQGIAMAQFYLGLMCERGVGVDQDDSMAMRWYAKAAAQGHEDAQMAISSLLVKRRSASASAAAEQPPSVEGEQ